MAGDHRESALREQALARSMVRAAMGFGGIDHASASDIELGRFVGLRNKDALWVWARPITSDAGSPNSGATGVLGTTLTTVAQSRLRSPSPIKQVTIVGEAGSLGVVARQAAYFPLDIAVMEVDGSTLSSVAPASHAECREPSAAHLGFAELFRSAGAEVVVEHGVVAAEVKGLEVARVVDEDGTARMRIGVGVHDRETFRMLHGDNLSVDHLRDVVRHVAQHRAVGAPAHPLNRLAPERALRTAVSEEPTRIKARGVQPAEPPIARVNLKDSVPCVATVTMLDGADAVVVFTAGVMVDAVPFAADARERVNPGAQLLIVADARNVLPTQLHLAAMLRQPASFVSA